MDFHLMKTEDDTKHGKYCEICDLYYSGDVCPNELEIN